MSIVNDIYTNHYITWYSTFLSLAAIEDYKKHINDLLDNIEASLKPDEKMQLNSLPIGMCEYYMSTHCFYKYSDISTAGFAKSAAHKHSNLNWILGIPLIIIFAIIFTFVLFFLLNMFNIETDDIAPLLAPITSIITGILALAFSNNRLK